MFYDIGHKIGRFTILGFSHLNKHRNRVWVCLCECGTQKLVPGFNLRHGTISCGCYNREINIAKNTKHGHSQRKGETSSPEYNSWHNMIQRVTNPKMEGFEDYGGRGITVCERWRNSFSAFLEDLGPKPIQEGMKYSVERIDVNGNYCPENCKWADQFEQARNQRPRKKGYKVIRKKKHIILPPLADQADTASLADYR